MGLKCNLLGKNGKDSSELNQMYFNVNDYILFSKLYKTFYLLFVRL